MARFTYTSINYTRGTSLRSEVPLVFVCSKSSTRVDGYNVQFLQMIQGRCSKSRKFCAVLSQIAWRVRRSNKRRCANVRRSSEAKHCSSLCSQSEGDEYCGGQTRLKIQRRYALKRWLYSLRVRGPHFASKVSYNAGAATDDCVGLRGLKAQQVSSPGQRPGYHVPIPYAL